MINFHYIDEKKKTFLNAKPLLSRRKLVIVLCETFPKIVQEFNHQDNYEYLQKS